MRLVEGQAPPRESPSPVKPERRIPEPPVKPDNSPGAEPRREVQPPKRPDNLEDAPARTHSRHQQNRPERQQPGQESPQTPGRRQADQSFFPGQRPDATDNSHSVRQLADRSSFYRHQNDAVSCSAFSMAMMYSDHKLGRPVNDSEAYKFKQLAGVTSHGYRGSLADMGRQLESAGLHAKPYEYANNFNERGMADLNRELAAGHSAVARVINPHTGNPHYIYIAGRDSSGRYIVGDPDRKNLANHQPVSAERLYSMMRGRNGFVAGW